MIQARDCGGLGLSRSKETCMILDLRLIRLADRLAM